MLFGFHFFLVYYVFASCHLSQNTCVTLCLPPPPEILTGPTITKTITTTSLETPSIVEVSKTETETKTLTETLILSPSPVSLILSEPTLDDPFVFFPVIPEFSTKSETTTSPVSEESSSSLNAEETPHHDDDDDDKTLEPNEQASSPSPDGCETPLA
jgi:hypothetical protein